MKKLLTLSAILFAFTVFATPVAEAKVTYEAPYSYSEWKEAGNCFWGGFRGQLSYLAWLTPENREIYISNGMSGVAKFENQPISDWFGNTDFDEDWNYIVVN
jgi:hypothetical protein